MASSLLEVVEVLLLRLVVGSITADHDHLVDIVVPDVALAAEGRLQVGEVHHVYRPALGALPLVVLGGLARLFEERSFLGLCPLLLEV